LYDNDGVRTNAAKECLNCEAEDLIFQISNFKLVSRLQPTRHYSLVIRLYNIDWDQLSFLINMPSMIVISKHEWDSLKGGSGELALVIKGNASADHTNDGGGEILLDEQQPKRTNRQKGAKRKLKKKDPNKPKHPITAYLSFTCEMVPKLKAVGIAVTGNALGERWRMVSEQERKKHERNAAEDRSRYWKEMAIYRARQCLTVS